MRHSNILTIGIPLRNKAEFIRDTLRALIEQSFTNWNCIISENLSEDFSFEEAKSQIKSDSRFKIIQQNRLLEPHENWNFLLKQTKSKYFKLLHGDDVLDKYCLENSIKAFEFHPDIVMVSGKRKVSANPKFDKTSNYTHPKIDKIYDKEMFITKHKRFGKNFVGEPSFVIFRTEELKSAGGFDSNWNYLIDMATYGNVLEYGNLLMLKNFMGTFRISTNSWSHKLSHYQAKEELNFLKRNNSSKVISGKPLIYLRSKLRRIALRLIHLKNKIY